MYLIYLHPYSRESNLIYSPLSSSNETSPTELLVEYKRLAKLNICLFGLKLYGLDKTDLGKPSQDKIMLISHYFT